MVGSVLHQLVILDDGYEEWLLDATELPSRLRECLSYFFAMPKLPHNLRECIPQIQEYLAANIYSPNALLAAGLQETHGGGSDPTGGYAPLSSERSRSARIEQITHFRRYKLDSYCINSWETQQAQQYTIYNGSVPIKGIIYDSTASVWVRFLYEEGSRGPL